jgi:hypothetical protein
MVEKIRKKSSTGHALTIVACALMAANAIVYMLRTSQTTRATLKSLKPWTSVEKLLPVDALSELFSTKTEAIILSDSQEENPTTAKPYTAVASDPQQLQAPVSPGAPFAVFLNAYFPQGEEKVAKTLDALKEQVHQIGTSFAASLVDQPLTLYYNTLGNSNGINATTMTEICSQYDNLVCQHMEHFDSGFEEVTLDKLYDYCHEPNRESHRVVYLHNKGSHNPDGWFSTKIQKQIRQDVWRRHGTAAATSELCLRPPNDTCNACGILWTPIPWQHVSAV